MGSTAPRVWSAVPAANSVVGPGFIPGGCFHVYAVPLRGAVVRETLPLSPGISPPDYRLIKARYRGAGTPEDRRRCTATSAVTSTTCTRWALWHLRTGGADNPEGNRTVLRSPAFGRFSWYSLFGATGLLAQWALLPPCRRWAQWASLPFWRSRPQVPGRPCTSTSSTRGPPTTSTVSSSPFCHFSSRRFKAQEPSFLKPAPWP